MIPRSVRPSISESSLMIKLSRILQDHRDSGAMNALVPLHAAVDDQTFLTKRGDLITILEIRGADYECLDAPQLDVIARRFESALRAIDEGFRLQQYVLKRGQPPIPARRYDHPVVQQAVTTRREYLTKKAEQLYSLETYFAIVYEGWAQRRDVQASLAASLRHPWAALERLLSSPQRVVLLENELDRARELLRNKVASFIVQLPDEIRAEVLDKRRAFRFVRRLLNYAPVKSDSVELKYDGFVDFQACDSLLECHRDHLRLDEFYVEVLTLKEPPTRTFAHLLSGLNIIDCSFIVTSDWKRASEGEIRKLVHSKRRHFHNSKSSMMNYVGSSGQTAPKDMLVDNSAVALVDDLGGCLEELEVNGRAFGEFSLTIVLYHEDRAVVRRAAAECFKVFAAHDAQLIDERYNLLNAWCATLPGNSAFNLRTLWLLDTNCADLSFLFTLHTGEPENAHLRAEYLAVLESNYRTPYFLNLHYQDIAHSIILGATGSGKSFVLNFLLTHLQKYDPLTYILDLGGSYESLTTLFAGSYLPIGLERQPFTINPFALSQTPANLQFLASFIKVLIESNHHPITEREERDIREQIENLYVVDPSQRRLATLVNLVQRDLRLPLQKWVQGGPYGAVFDNAEDNLTFARFQTFDFEGMQKVPQVLEPFLFYILHRANAAIYDSEQSTTFKVFVIDEAWTFLRHPTIRRYILEGLKTWRKKNAAMILATQSSDDLLRSEMLSVVLESCATKIFLANPDIDQKAYRDAFHLNETEAQWIARLVPKRQMLVKRPDMSKVLNLNVDRKDYWLYTSNPYDRARRREAFERYGFEEGLNILARSNPK
jgi:type IV secretion/conjugal transfer VirB4 family ATPase